ncbi:MAG: type IV secretory system conjugative DNA transfer family protein [Acaryochloris sp. RU_4_1]|nr:type IV secretory system conjugative DNA transfer family protein [Acaryochloris sp. RU_4_1]
MQHHTQQPAQQPQISSPQMDFQVYVMGGLFLAILILVVISKGELGRKKQKLGDARKATPREIKKAKDYGFDMMEERKRNKVALWVGEPKGVVINRETREIFVPRDYVNSWILSHLEEHLVALGSTGSGKSYSLLNPLQRSMIKLGYPLAVFDAKGHEESETSTCPSSEIAGYARLHGYKVKIIAPGYDDSDVFNIYHMIRSRFGREAYEDKDGAGVVSEVLSENLAKTAADNGDEFFPLAAKQLLQSVFLLALYLDPNANFVLAFYLLERIVEIGAAGIRSLDLPPYLRSSFSQYLASEKSAETGASIAGTTLLQFNRMFTPANVATFCGQSTVELEIKGKTLVIFRLNPELKASVGPMIATTIQCFMLANAYRAREQPLGFILDECQMVKLCGVQEMQTVTRSNGVFFVFASQGFSFLKRTYGEKGAMGLIEGCKTQVIGQLNANEPAEYYSKQFGQKEIKSRSKSKSSGKHSSNSESDQPHLKDLVPLQELLGLPQGQFYYLNRAIRNERMARIPVLYETVIPKWEEKEIKQGITEWFRYRKVARANSKALAKSDDELIRYQTLAREALPEPEPDQQQPLPSQEDGNQTLAIGIASL